MNIFSLCLSFFLTGLFAIGGGLAAIPIMQQFIVDRGWISRELFYNMVAVSESTPGPIGVNMATYIGFENYGVFGGIITTLCLTLPSFLTVFFIARSFTSMQEKEIVRDGLYGIRASVAGLIASAAWSVLTVTIFTFDN
ncbi:MAG: chromate transporter, partial [Oscillospiraceae bacterium]|nr:chromate transporter [Oscillospiraceae bacterium]